jgi:O-antigen/teichoic acid export membrane protein
VWGRADLYDVLIVFALNVPIVGVMTILLAAARAVMDMKGDALVRGLATPLLLIVSSIVVYPFVPTVYGLGLALTISNVVGMGASIWYFNRRYSLRRLWAARKRPAPKGLLVFAVPQSINMTLWQGIWNLDVLMLAAYVDDASLGLYRTVAEIARVVFSIRFSFSSVYAPLVARYTLENDHAGMQDSYTRLSRWIGTIAAPVVVGLVLFQGQILWAFNPAYSGGAAFMWLLLIGPLLACVTGLSGNILVMTGNHFWNLANSAVLLGVNAGLNVVLIPRYGMMGASLATMVGISGASLLQIAEVHYLMKVKVELAKIYKPIAAGGVALVAAWFAGAAAHGLGGLAAAVPVKAVVMVAVYLGALWALRLEREDAEMLARWRARKK